MIVGADVLAVAARRWAGDILENAKQWAFAAALPEADHNLLVGFGRPPEANRQVHALLLDGPAVHARNRLRVELTARELDEAGVSHEVVELGGGASPRGDAARLLARIVGVVLPSAAQRRRSAAHASARSAEGGDGA